MLLTAVYIFYILFPLKFTVLV